jgi:hypothetical protein
VVYGRVIFRDSREDRDGYGVQVLSIKMLLCLLCLCCADQNVVLDTRVLARLRQRVVARRL